MSLTLSDILSPYDYKLPPELIANEPVKPRDKARLLVMKRGIVDFKHDIFLNLYKYLPERAVLVFNETRVLQARLEVRKETGGRVKLLYLAEYGGCIRVLFDRKLATGSKLWLSSRIFFNVQGREQSHYFLKPSFGINDTLKVLKKYGSMPLPPYIKDTSLNNRQLRESYQTVFARNPGSIAAPTASLHFTKRMFNKFAQQRIAARYVTLHVGLGTFAPLQESNLSSGKLHEESYEITPKTAQFLSKAKRENRPIIAVGTTVMRVLETASNARGALTRLNGVTDLFIREGYSFKFVEGLITNFHVPKSSLLMLVSAFAGRAEIMEVYKTAMREKYRFYSFGDGILIL